MPMLPESAPLTVTPNAWPVDWCTLNCWCASAASGTRVARMITALTTQARASGPADRCLRQRTTSTTTKTACWNATCQSPKYWVQASPAVHTV